MAVALADWNLMAFRGRRILEEEAAALEFRVLELLKMAALVDQAL